MKLSSCCHMHPCTVILPAWLWGCLPFLFLLCPSHIFTHSSQNHRTQVQSCHPYPPNFKGSSCPEDNGPQHSHNTLYNMGLIFALSRSPPAVWNYFQTPEHIIALFCLWLFACIPPSDWNILLLPPHLLSANSYLYLGSRLSCHFLWYIFFDPTEWGRYFS